MEAENNILRAKNLSIGYRKKGGNKAVATGIGISLQPGRVTALIGANGAGKSTLIKTLTGILSPLHGDVFLQGRALSTYDYRELAQHIAVVLTEKLPPGNLTVYELVALGRQPYTNWLGQLTDFDKKSITTALQQTQTEALYRQKHFEISDGQLQKVLIARALAQDTPIIILDEPTTHLDLLHKVQVLRLLQTLAHSQNKCIFFSTHDLELAMQFSDDIIVMAGTTTVQGTPAALSANGTLNALFGEGIHFDAASGRFLYNTK